MGIYKTSGVPTRGVSSTLTGFVKAYNQASADAEMTWIQAHVTCFCHICVKGLVQNYSVYIEPSSESHSITQTLSGGVYAV